MQTIEQPMTLGNRYTREIKLLTARLMKGKEKAIGIAEDAIPDLRAAAIKGIAKILGIPKKKIDIRDMSKGVYSFDSDTVYFMYNGADCFVSREMLFSKSLMNTYRVKRDAHSDIKRQFCKEHELIVHALGSAMINKFKAFCNARYDHKSTANDLPAGAFKSLVAEFLETQRTHTCPL